MNIEDAINLDDLRKIAKRRLPRVVYDFIEGGADDEAGLIRNEDAFHARPLLPRYLVDVSVRDQTRELFGKTYSSPFGIAPTGGIGLYRHGGDMMLARAACDANIPFIMSGTATASMEDLAAVAPEHGWYQIYAAKDKSISDDQIRRVRELGLSTLVITVDVPSGANRERNKRNGFGRPLKLSLGAKLDALRRPLWLKEYLQHGRSTFPNWRAYAPQSQRDDADAMGDFITTQVRAPLTWDDIARWRDLWPRSLVIKGIMRADDALRAADLGVDGIIVSNHGARQLDRAPSPLAVLPVIHEAVGERLTLMLDSGVRRGSDVLTALCLGARFVFLGRSTLYGVVAGGTAGASKAITILHGEIDTVLAQIGCPTLDDLGADFVQTQSEDWRKNQ